MIRAFLNLKNKPALGLHKKAEESAWIRFISKTIAYMNFESESMFYSSIKGDTSKVTQKMASFFELWSLSNINPMRMPISNESKDHKYAVFNSIYSAFFFMYRHDYENIKNFFTNNAFYVPFIRIMSSIRRYNNSFILFSRGLESESRDWKQIEIHNNSSTGQVIMNAILDCIKDKTDYFTRLKKQSKKKNADFDKYDEIFREELGTDGLMIFDDNDYRNSLLHVYERIKQNRKVFEDLFED